MVAITVIHVLDILLVCSIDRMSCHVYFSPFYSFVPHFLFTQVNSRKKERVWERENKTQRQRKGEWYTCQKKTHTKKEGKNKVPVGVSWYNNGRGLILWRCTVIFDHLHQKEGLERRRESGRAWGRRLDLSGRAKGRGERASGLAFLSRLQKKSGKLPPKKGKR